MVYNLLDILHLPEGILLELSGVEVWTGAELQGLFAERVANGIVGMKVGLVDDIVQCGTCKITQENGLTVGCRLQSP